MMRRLMATMTVVSALGVGGCAIADVRPGIVRHETPKQMWSKFHGPDVRIRANVVSTQNSRMIQPVVSLGDSAYLVIGDIGDDGTLRIVYPTRPGEPNFVSRKGSFEGPRFQPRVVLPFIRTTFSTARSAPGHTFVIASSSPLDLSKLAEGDRWSVFDVYYDNHMNDPRPAITDLAASIATNVGDISISYAPYAWGIVGTRASSAQRLTPRSTRPGDTSGVYRRPPSRPLE
jgi:hypothetical protein